MNELVGVERMAECKDCGAMRPHRADTAGVMRCVTCAEFEAKVERERQAELGAAKTAGARFNNAAEKPASIGPKKNRRWDEFIFYAVCAALILGLLLWRASNRDDATKTAPAESGTIARVEEPTKIYTNSNGTAAVDEQRAGEYVLHACASTWPPKPFVQATKSVVGYVNVDVRFAEAFNTEPERYEVTLENGAVKRALAQRASGTRICGGAIPYAK